MKKKRTPVKKRGFNSAKVVFIIGLALLLAGIGFHIYLVSEYNFTQDDAFITFRYAENFIQGNGLVYNAGERVEGYTNFLWLQFMIIGRLFGADYVLFSKILGALFGVGTILMIFLIGLKVYNRNYLLAGLTSIVLAAVYSFAYWSVAGLETAAFAFMVAATVYFYLTKSSLAASTALLATLLRPEGALVFGILILYDIIINRKLTKWVMVLIAIYVIPLIPYAIFKWSYFGGLLPNPFYAKTSFNYKQLYNGLEYVGQFFHHYVLYGLFLVPFLIAFRRWNKSVRFVAFLTLIYTIYIIVIGGDVLKVHRFFVPIIPFFALIMIYGFSEFLKWKPVAIIGAMMIVAWQLYAPTNHVQTYLRNEIGLSAKMENIIGQLKRADRSDFSIAVSTIGLVGYRLMGHTVIDMLGLTDSTIARHPEPPAKGIKSTWKEANYNSQYLLSRAPDYILFSTGNKPSAPAEFSLFTYSAFLNSYRTVGFYYNGYVHDFYKKMFPIEPPVERDVNALFGRLYNEGINQWRAGNFEKAKSIFENAIRYSPKPVYPYIYYYLGEVARNQQDLPEAYKQNQIASRMDSTLYLVERDLYIYDKCFLNKEENAALHYKRLQKLVPWYMDRVDSVTADLEKDLEKFRKTHADPLTP